MKLYNYLAMGAAGACLVAAALLNPASSAPVPPVIVSPAPLPTARTHQEVSSDMNELNTVGGPRKVLSPAQTATSDDVLKAVRGEDKNHDGMRDDAERYVPRNAHTPVQKAALIRLVSAYTTAMTTPLDDTIALASAASGLMHARQCMSVAFKGQGRSLNDVFTAVAVNTTVRMHAYHHFRQALSGIAVVRTKGQSCD